MPLRGCDGNSWKSFPLVNTNWYRFYWLFKYQRRVPVLIPVIKLLGFYLKTFPNLNMTSFFFKMLFIECFTCWSMGSFLPFYNSTVVDVFFSVQAIKEVVVRQTELLYPSDEMLTILNVGWWLSIEYEYCAYLQEAAFSFSSSGFFFNGMYHYIFIALFFASV